VVSTNVGGVPYLVTHNNTALLVSPGDDQEMAEAVFSLLRNPALGERLAKAGHDEIHDYTWPRVRGQLFAVYDLVLARTVNDNPEQQDAR
jgi:glycosyltransferase involved in cell wall biosynthesis